MLFPLLKMIVTTTKKQQIPTTDIYEPKWLRIKVTKMPMYEKTAACFEELFVENSFIPVIFKLLYIMFQSL